MLDTFAIIVASGLGIGLVEPVRSLLATAVIVALFSLFPPDAVVPRVSAVIVLSVAGFVTSQLVGVASGTTDDGRIIIDEMAAAALLLTLVRPANMALACALGLAFVVLDGLKPWPASAVENWPEAWGVMGDDLVLALVMGVAVCIIARAIRRLTR